MRVLMCAFLLFVGFSANAQLLKKLASKDKVAVLNFDPGDDCKIETTQETFTPDKPIYIRWCLEKSRGDAEGMVHVFVDEVNVYSLLAFMSDDYRFHAGNFASKGTATFPLIRSNEDRKENPNNYKRLDKILRQNLVSGKKHKITIGWTGRTNSTDIPISDLEHSTSFTLDCTSGLGILQKGKSFKEEEVVSIKLVLLELSGKGNWVHLKPDTEMYPDYRCGWGAEVELKDGTKLLTIDNEKNGELDPDLFDIEVSDGIKLTSNSYNKELDLSPNYRNFNKQGEYGFDYTIWLQKSPDKKYSGTYRLSVKNSINANYPGADVDVNVYKEGDGLKIVTKKIGSDEEVWLIDPKTEKFKVDCGGSNGYNENSTSAYEGDAGGDGSDGGNITIKYHGDAKEFANGCIILDVKGGRGGKGGKGSGRYGPNGRDGRDGTITEL